MDVLELIIIDSSRQTVTDMPCILFADELLAAYPLALVILTERDEASWLVSMDRTILELLRWKTYDYIAPFDTVKALALPAQGPRLTSETSARN